MHIVIAHLLDIVHTMQEIIKILAFLYMIMFMHFFIFGAIDASYVITTIKSVGAYKANYLYDLSVSAISSYYPYLSYLKTEAINATYWTSIKFNIFGSYISDHNDHISRNNAFMDRINGAICICICLGITTC